MAGVDGFRQGTTKGVLPIIVPIASYRYYKKREVIIENRFLLQYILPHSIVLLKSSKESTGLYLPSPVLFLQPVLPYLYHVLLDLHPAPQTNDDFFLGYHLHRIYQLADHALVPLGDFRRSIFHHRHRIFELRKGGSIFSSLLLIDQMGLMLYQR